MPTEWYYKVMGQEIGPVSSIHLKKLADSGQLNFDALVRRSTDDRWYSADAVSGLLGSEKRQSHGFDPSTLAMDVNFSKITVHTLALPLLLWASIAVASEREWKDFTGKYSVRAEMLDCRDDMVLLKRTDGTLRFVAMAKLSTADQAFAKRDTQAAAKSNVLVQRWETREKLPLLSLNYLTDPSEVTLTKSQKTRGLTWLVVEARVPAELIAPIPPERVPKESRGGWTYNMTISQFRLHGSDGSTEKKDAGETATSFKLHEDDRFFNSSIIMGGKAGKPAHLDLDLVFLVDKDTAESRRLAFQYKGLPYRLLPKEAKKGTSGGITDGRKDRQENDTGVLIKSLLDTDKPHVIGPLHVLLEPTLMTIESEKHKPRPGHALKALTINVTSKNKTPKTKFASRDFRLVGPGGKKYVARGTYDSDFPGESRVLRFGNTEIELLRAESKADVTLVFELPVRADIETFRLVYKKAAGP